MPEFGESAENSQVAIDEHHIGGLKDTLHYLKEEELSNGHPTYPYAFHEEVVAELLEDRDDVLF